jgi:hypothetical protein
VLSGIMSKMSNSHPNLVLVSVWGKLKLRQDQQPMKSVIFDFDWLLGTYCISRVSSLVFIKVRNKSHFRGHVGIRTTSEFSEITQHDHLKDKWDSLSWPWASVLCLLPQDGQFIASSFAKSSQYLLLKAKFNWNTAMPTHSPESLTAFSFPQQR